MDGTNRLDRPFSSKRVDFPKLLQFHARDHLLSVLQYLQTDLSLYLHLYLPTSTEQLQDRKKTLIRTGRSYLFVAIYFLPSHHLAVVC